MATYSYSHYLYDETGDGVWDYGGPWGDTITEQAGNEDGIFVVGEVFLMIL